MSIISGKRTLTFAMLALFAGSAFSGCLGGDTGNGGDGNGNETNGNETGGGNGAADQALILGTLLPLTGSLEAYGPDMERGAQLAIKMINDAGGVNGHPVELVTEDSATDATQAPNAMNNLINEGVAGVVGAASSTVTGSILPIAVSNGVIVVTPASTSPALTTDRDNEGHFYRVPPSDALQGRVLAQLVQGEGHMTASIIAENGAYGVGLGNVFEETFESMGGTVQEYVRYETGGTTFASQVQQAASGNPDAIVLIGYPREGGQIMREAYQNGLLEDTTFYFSEGLYDAAFVENTGDTSEGTPILAGLKGTTPSSAGASATTTQFNEAFMAEYGEEPGLFAAETFDGIWALALAAQRGSENNAETMLDYIVNVWNEGGTEVTAFDAQAALDAAESGDVNYVGAANDFDWDENGDPQSGVYAYWQVAEDGTLEVVQENVEP